MLDAFLKNLSKTKKKPIDSNINIVSCEVWFGCVYKWSKIKDGDQRWLWKMKEERWKIKDEKCKMKVERWKMKDERWKMKDERWMLWSCHFLLIRFVLFNE